MTADEYEQRLKQQKGTCALCRKPETARTRQGNLKLLAVDHDHATGAVRKLLCVRCNNIVARVEADPQFYAKVLDYIKDV